MTKLSLIYKFSFVALLACFFMRPGIAQVVVTETQPLSFGTFSFTDFNRTVRINIRNNGTANPNGNVVIIDPPTRGEYSMTSDQFNTVYTVTTPVSVTLPGPGGDFIIDNFRVRPNSLVTDAAGSDDFRIAARISSAGDGTAYNNGIYSTTFDITIAF
jgi:hypothetical protein